MNFSKIFPANFDVSLAFIVLMMAVLTFYMGFRCIRRIGFLSVASFVMELCLLTLGVLTVLNSVVVTPVYEMITILLGILMPLAFFYSDYSGMKRRIKASSADVSLVERLEKQDSNKDWHYEEFIENPEEWKAEIKAGVIIKTLNLSDKHIRTNVTQQLLAVHKLIDTGSCFSSVGWGVS